MIRYRHNKQHDFEGETYSKPPVNKIGRFEDMLCRKFERYDILAPNKDLYLRRWLLRRWGPSSPFEKLYLHKIYTKDQDRHLHNHPWKALVGLFGPVGYMEEYFPDNEPFADVDMERSMKEERLVLRIAKTRLRFHLPFTARVLKPADWHRVILHRDLDGNEIPCWSFCLVTPKVQRWGFLTEYGACDSEDYFDNYDFFNPPGDKS